MWIFGDGQFRYESGVLSVEIYENERSQNERTDESISSKRSRGTCEYEHEMESYYGSNGPGTGVAVDRFDVYGYTVKYERHTP